MNFNDSDKYEKRNCFNKVMEKTNSQKKFMKNIMSRSGSYNVTSSEDESNSLHFIDSYTNSLPNSKANFKSTNSILQMISGFSNKSDANFYQNESSNKQSKPHKRLMGLSLLYLTYLAAFYTLIAYSASSFITIVFIIQNLDVMLIPLYILLVSYSLIAIMSLFLIFGIKKDRLNIITFWVILISVFLLPEIGLNIILLESKPDWSYNEYRFLLISLITRILLDLPAIFFVLTYHINQIKRNNHLQDMLQPLKNNIVNGEVLKIYNNIKLDPFEQPTNNCQVSNPLTHQHSEDINPVSQNTNAPNRYLYRFSNNQAIYLKEVKNIAKTEDQLVHKKTIPQQDKTIENFNYDKKALRLTWGKNPTSIQSQDQLNVINETCEDSFTNDEIIAHHYYKENAYTRSENKLIDDLNSVSSRPNYQNDSISVDAVFNQKQHIENSNYIQMMQNEFNKLPVVKANPLYMHNITQNCQKQLPRRSNSLSNKAIEQDMDIPIEYEGPIIRLMIKKNEPMKLQQIPKLENGSNLTMQKKVNISNHHIYLPPGPDFTPKFEEDSTLAASSLETSTSPNKIAPENYSNHSAKDCLLQNDNKLNQVDL